MKKVTLIIIIITLSSKILGFGREIALAYFYGTTNISDAFLISLTIPLTLFSFIGTGLATSYIPVYSSLEKDNSNQTSVKFTSNVINLVILVSILLILISVIFTTPIVKLFASGFNGSTLETAVFFTRISVIGIVFSGLVYILTAYLQVNNSFVIPALIGIPYNVILVSAIVFSFYTNIIILPLGNVIGPLSQLALLLPFVYKLGFKYSFNLDYRNKYFSKMMHLSLPVIIGVSVEQINKLIDRTLASQIVVGGISALTYASRLNWFIQGIFAVSIATVMYPHISKMAATKNEEGFKKAIRGAINSISLFIIPATIGSMFLSEAIVALLFGRGAFGTDAVLMTSNALFYYSIGMVGFGLREVLSRAFYSFQDTKTPMVNGLIAMTINIILNFILSKFLGIGGLALATSISSLIGSLLLFISLRKKIGSFGSKVIIITLFKVLSASLVMGVIAKALYNTLNGSISSNLSLITSIIIGILIYLIFIHFMKIEDFDTLMKVVKDKFKKILF